MCCALTGLSSIQITTVVEALRDARRVPGRPWAASLSRRVLVACASLRTNLTLRELAAVFGMSTSQVHRIVTDLVPKVAALLRGSPCGDRRRTWIIDGTLVPTRDHRAAAKAKIYRWACNLQVLVRHADRAVVAIAGGGPGHRNDPVHYRGSIVEQRCRAHGRVLADGGYRGIATAQAVAYLHNLKTELRNSS